MQTKRGMTLIDVVIGTALVLIIFVALFGLMRASVQVSAFVKSEATAAAIANSQMEYIRSLPYTSVGTVGGIPSGSIPEYATTTEDNENYSVRSFIEFYEDPAASTTQDYKIIKVTVTYIAGSGTRQISLVSDYAPPYLEASTGGTLEINVVNSKGAPVSGASVTITNSSTTPSVNLSTFSDSGGNVFLPGAATSTQYAVTVTEAGYSTAQTYARTGINQNPNPGYMTVVGNQTTSGTFAIDLLGTLTLSTYIPIATTSFTDNFANSSELSTLTNTVAGGGALTLSGGAGNYSPTGIAISNTITPSYLYGWSTASSTMNTPSGTSAIIQVVDGNGNLIPNSVLPGNATGFTSFPINLYGISTTTYPSLALEATLQTTSTSTTPSLSGWSLTYQKGPVPLPNIPFTLTGAKTIGSTGAGAPIYKTIVATSTNSSGEVAMPLEWDSYSLSLSGYDVVDACGAPPFALSPGASLNESLYLSTNTSNSLLVSVTDGSGNPVPGASVTVSRTGYTNTVTTSACGQAYFGGLTAASDYSVSASATGYTTTNSTGVSVSGDTFYVQSF